MHKKPYDGKQISMIGRIMLSEKNTWKRSGLNIIKNKAFFNHSFMFFLYESAMIKT